MFWLEILLLAPSYTHILYIILIDWSVHGYFSNVYILSIFIVKCTQGLLCVLFLKPCKSVDFWGKVYFVSQCRCSNVWCVQEFQLPTMFFPISILLSYQMAKLSITEMVWTHSSRDFTAIFNVSSGNCIGGPFPDCWESLSLSIFIFIWPCWVLQYLAVFLADFHMAWEVRVLTDSSWKELFLMEIPVKHLAVEFTWFGAISTWPRRAGSS